MKKNQPIAYLYILPSMLIVFTFSIFPIIFNLGASLTRWRGFQFETAEFVGLQNYQTIFNDHVFIGSLRNYAFFMVLTISLQLALGLIFTVLLSRVVIGKRVLETFLFLPVVLSTVVIGYTFSQIFEPNFGTLNRFLGSVGLDSLQRTWIGDPRYAIYTLLIANVYQWAGMGIIYYRAGMSNISKEIYEGAKIDGAGFWQSFFRITVPLLKHTHQLLILLGIIGCLKFFDLVYIMTRGGPAGATEFPLTYLYKRFVIESNSGLASAAAVTIIVIAVTLAAIQMKFNERSEKRGEKI